jgi:hypothetical protein
MRKKLWLAICVTVAFGVLPAVGAFCTGQKEAAPTTTQLPAGVDPNKEVVPGVKRGDCIIIEDPTGALSSPDSFNRWSCWAAEEVGPRAFSNWRWIPSGLSIRMPAFPVLA